MDFWVGTLYGWLGKWMYGQLDGWAVKKNGWMCFHFLYSSIANVPPVCKVTGSLTFQHSLLIKVYLKKKVLLLFG